MDITAEAALHSMHELSSTLRFERRLIFLIILQLAGEAAELVIVVLLSACGPSSLSGSSARMASHLGAAAMVGQVLGAIIGGSGADRFGRRPCFVSAGAAVAFFGLASAVSPSSLSALLLVRCLVGLGVGAGNPVSAVLLTEYLPTRGRGENVVSVRAVSSPVGGLYVTLCAWLVLSYQGWRALAILAALPACASAVVAFQLIPESPRWLQRRGRAEEAAAVIAGVARDNGVELPNGALRLSAPVLENTDDSNPLLQDTDEHDGVGDDISLRFREDEYENASISQRFLSYIYWPWSLQQQRYQARRPRFPRRPIQAGFQLSGAGDDLDFSLKYGAAPTEITIRKKRLITMQQQSIFSQQLRSTVCICLASFLAGSAYLASATLSSLLFARVVGERQVRSCASVLEYRGLALGSIVEAIASLAAARIVDKGRRRLFAGLSILAAFELLMLACPLAALPKAIVAHVARGALFAAVSVLFAFAPELYPTEARATGASCASACGKLGGALAAAIFVPNFAAPSAALRGETPHASLSIYVTAPLALMAIAAACCVLLVPTETARAPAFETKLPNTLGTSAPIALRPRNSSNKNNSHGGDADDLSPHPRAAFGRRRSFSSDDGASPDNSQHDVITI
mmetsp:Transcript_14113/g.18850  ORF Transcript_14113/g.18850 Transcript_14113/m.18850 type:complete len:630 (+) Transcript_14113:26-1915(+)